MPNPQELLPGLTAYGNDEGADVRCKGGSLLPLDGSNRTAIFTPPETRDDVASFGPEALEALKKEFKGLDESAREKALAITPASKALGVAWDNLLPDLDKMQSLLPQRGENRELFRDADLPTWSGWWKSFQRKTSLDTTLHTVQVRLKKFRSMDEPTDKPKLKRGPTVQLSVANRHPPLVVSERNRRLPSCACTSGGGRDSGSPH